jgi:sporulation protein YlmC with PRC-barrel domain
MTRTILMSASILAMLAAVPAFAETRVEGNTTIKTEESVGAKVEKQLDKAGNAIEKAANKTEAAAKETYGNVKAYFTDEKNLGTTSTVSLAKNHTSKALIGTDVVDPNGKTIGKINDIIVDREGDAEWVVIEDGGILGLGTKLAAFDYDIIKSFNRDKDVNVKLTEATLKAAKPFEYKASANDQGAARTTLGANQFSVKDLTSASVIGPDNKKIADVETVVFDGDDAEYVLVSFDKILGMGGDTAALDFDALEIYNNNGKHSFKLNNQQTAQFENFKKQSKSN